MRQRHRFALAAIASAVFAVSGTAGAQVGRNQGAIDPNVATEQQLLAVPGVNAAIAKAIIDKRPFLSITELDAFLGGQSLTKEQRTAVYPKMFIAINLNTASRDEILLVPGVGARMAHEFEEYRPYKGGLPQFRKEIGKYVNAAEVARLEQYVFVPINLNTASDSAILSIPGLGQRMLREFKEYRPYRSMEQFRKEIGKYVNAREVARLERYVTLE
jgi:DNA uptake protein ComE-like DNA-binding protein